MCAFDRESKDTIAILCARGYGKRTTLSDFPVKNRGGYGVICIKTSQRNGPVSSVRIVADDDHIIVISDHGKLIRLRVRDIPVLGRATQGVRIMRVDEDERVVSVERLAEGDDSDIEQGSIEASPLEAAADEPDEEGADDSADEADDVADDEGADDDGADDDGEEDAES
jgi:DNA gyrase subunit A